MSDGDVVNNSDAGLKVSTAVMEEEDGVYVY
jgi:hypothetical protein